MPPRLLVAGPVTVEQCALSCIHPPSPSSSVCHAHMAYFRSAIAAATSAEHGAAPAAAAHSRPRSLPSTTCGHPPPVGFLMRQRCRTCACDKGSNRPTLTNGLFGLPLFVRAAFSGSGTEHSQRRLGTLSLNARRISQSSVALSLPESAGC